MPSLMELLMQSGNPMISGMLGSGGGASFDQRFYPPSPPGYSPDPSMSGLFAAMDQKRMPGTLPSQPTAGGPNIAPGGGLIADPMRPALPPAMPQTGMGGPPGQMPPPMAPPPAPPMQMPVQPPQQAGGFKGFMNGPKGEALMGLLAGWAQGGTWQDSLGKGGMGAVQGLKQGKRNKTVELFLANSNLDPATKALLADDPELARAYISQMLQGDSGTDDMKEYRQAVRQGFDGSFIEYQIKMKEAGRANTTVNLNDWKIPAGYMLADEGDPSKGLKPIPGGPGEQLPAELAARTGMANSFLAQAPALREEIAKGEATGLWDRAVGGNIQSSEQAGIIRQMKSGTDALQRMLTGAGMPAAEAQQYAERYLPTYTDDAKSAAQKLDQLVTELEKINQNVMRGRGGVPQSPAPSGDVIDYTDFFK